MLNYHCASFAFNRYLKKKLNPCKNKFTKDFITHFSEKSSHLYKNKKIEKQVPVENGISCSNKEGVVIVNPKEFIHPEEK